MQPLKKLSPESIHAIARNSNKNVQSKCFFSDSDIQHRIRTEHFHDFVTEMNTIQKQSIDQNLQKLAETAVF